MFAIYRNPLLCRRATRSLRDLQEDYTTIQLRETETEARRHELELNSERLEAEVVTVRSDLKLALKRIQDLQNAMEEATDSSEEGDRLVPNCAFGRVAYFVMSRLATSKRRPQTPGRLVW